MNDTFKESPVVRYWQILVVMATLVFGGGSVFFQIGAMQEALADQQEEIEKVKDDNHKADIKLVEVVAGQRAIKDDVNEIKEKLQAQDKKLDRIIEKLNDVE